MRPLFLVNRVLRAPDSKKIMLDHPFTTAGSPFFYGVKFIQISGDKPVGSMLVLFVLGGFSV
jgi:hypothetical protein